MSDEKKYTERELILAKREAFKDGVRVVWNGLPLKWQGTNTESEIRYPLPKVTRPRVWQDAEGDEWRCVNGQLQYRRARETVWCDAEWWVTRDYLQATLDLLANPTEEVDA